MTEGSVSASLGNFLPPVNRTLNVWRQDRIMARIWSRDHTVWKPEPTEIANRLGWLDSPRLMADHLPEIERFTDAVRREGYTKALLLGMGGSSLAPEVFRRIFGVTEGYLDLAILDSTDPGAVLERARTLVPAQTLFLVSTKSGGTVETISFMKYFYTWATEALGPEEAGRHFAAVTDPGSDLADMAKALRFRHIFYNDPDIGGRYSALSFFGLVPAALIGMNMENLLRTASTVACSARTDKGVPEFGPAFLGAALGELAKAGRDKLTFLFSPQLEAFGDWLEQLIAESTGKEGSGILPVVGETLASPHVYGPDRFFVALRLPGDTIHDNALDLLEKAGHPVLRLTLRDAGELGGQIFLWELATAIAGARLGINPFDQPDVESAKAFARQIIAQYTERDGFPDEIPDYTEGSIAIFGNAGGKTARERLDHFFRIGKPGDYAAIQAYVTPTPLTDKALQKFRTAIRDRYGLAATVGYGPRFLHSTGQLHKGDAGRGLFLQITAGDSEDAAIPDRAGLQESSLTFGALKTAQALGDRRALLEAGRRVLRFHIAKDVVSTLTSLAS